MRSVAVVTVARSDYGIYRPVLQAIRRSPSLALRLLVSGMHLAPEFGNSVEQIRADGFAPIEPVEMLLASDTPTGIATSIGLGVLGFAPLFARERPDLLLVLGDRFEMWAATIAALPFAIPIAHLHGGERTEGAMDEAIRHSITKQSHLHFVATEAYRQRVIQLGEAPWRVTVSGAPALDNLQQLPLLPREALEQALGIPLEPAPLLVTFHPATLEHEQAGAQLNALLGALEEVGLPVLFTYPNADTGGRAMIDAIERWVRPRPNAWAVATLGTQRYFSAMRHAAAMVGNSSSGIIEAASFELPVVNIGSRQQGRLRGANVRDVAPDREQIVAAIREATSPRFRAGLAGMVNPYGDGHAAARIVEVLESVPLDERLIQKRFHDLPAAAGGAP